MFSNDNGGTDIVDAYNIAKELDNQLLLAFVYKYAYFFKNSAIDEQNPKLEKAHKIFLDNNMADNAIYCTNNILVRQFDTNGICVRQFSDMLGEAINNVPGLVGMSHLYNNTAIAYLMSAKPDRALELFDVGLEYANTDDRQVQYLAILCNRLIAKSYYGEKVEYADILRLFTQIYDGMICNDQLPFIAARYILNLLVIAIRENKSWGEELLEQYNVLDLINRGLKNNRIGSGQILKQLEYINQKLPHKDLKIQCIPSSEVIKVTGRRKEFIEKSGLNPFYFFTWI